MRIIIKAKVILKIKTPQLSERTMCMCIYKTYCMYVCIYLDHKSNTWKRKKNHVWKLEKLHRRPEISLPGESSILLYRNLYTFHSDSHIPSSTVYDALCTRTSCHFRITFHFKLCSKQFYIKNSVWSYCQRPLARRYPLGINTKEFKTIILLTATVTLVEKAITACINVDGQF